MSGLMLAVISTCVLFAGYCFWKLFFDPLLRVAALLKECKGRPLPNKLKPLTDKTFNHDDLLGYLITAEHMLKSIEDGSLSSISSQGLKYYSNQFGNHAAEMIAVRKHPILFLCIALATFGIVPIAIVVLQAAISAKFEKDARAFISKAAQREQNLDQHARSNLSDELSSLTKLRREGSLSDEEFALAKDRILKRA